MLAILLSCWLGASAPAAALTANPPAYPTASTQTSFNPFSGPRPPQGQAQARAVAPASDDFIPRVKVDSNGAVVPDIRAAAAVVYNTVTGEVIWGQNADVQRSIASITKLMTAVIFVESRPDLSEQVVVRRVDVRRASITYLRSGERLSLETLLHLLLIGSDNAAARVLARISPWGSDGFLDRMNEKAAELGLEHTRFTDPSGLHAGNVSSAFDLSKLLGYVARNDQLAPIMRMPEYTARTSRRRVRIENTNRLLESEFDILGGKTGFIRKAGYCLATLLQLPQGPQVAVVVLGARSNMARFLETRHILNWLVTTAQDLFLSEAPEPQQ